MEFRDFIEASSPKATSFLPKYSGGGSYWQDYKQRGDWTDRLEPGDNPLRAAASGLFTGFSSAINRSLPASPSGDVQKFAIEKLFQSATTKGIYYTVVMTPEEVKKYGTHLKIAALKKAETEFKDMKRHDARAAEMLRMVNLKAWQEEGVQQTDKGVEMKFFFPYFTVKSLPAGRFYFR